MERIPTHILADRLKRLESDGILRRDLYQERPKRYAYHLTEKGRDLEPVMRSLVAWSNKYISGNSSGFIFRHLGSRKQQHTLMPRETRKKSAFSQSERIAQSQ